MPAPVTVSIEVPHPRGEVFDYLDVMANHEPFNDHLMRDWQLSGPDRGVGSRATVHTRALGVSDVVDIEVTEAERPRLLVERNTARKARRVGEGTYTLEPTEVGGTQITFEFRWVEAPVADRLMSPLVRWFIRRNNLRALHRLAEHLDTQLATQGHAGPECTDT